MFERAYVTLGQRDEHQTVIVSGYPGGFVVEPISYENADGTTTDRELLGNAGAIAEELSDRVATNKATLELDDHVALVGGVEAHEIGAAAAAAHMLPRAQLNREAAPAKRAKIRGKTVFDVALQRVALGRCSGVVARSWCGLR
jgi:hypothetical protein